MFRLFNDSKADEYDRRLDAEERRYKYLEAVSGAVDEMAREIELTRSVDRYVRQEDARRANNVQGAIDGLFSTLARRAGR